MLDFIIWNGSPVLFSIGPFTLRWYAFLFIAGFLLARLLLNYMYRKVGKPVAEVERLTIYMGVAAAVGARLVHVIFYEPGLIMGKPLEILLPFSFQPEFHFTGLESLSSHGAFVGIAIVIWFHGRRRGTGRSFLQVLDLVAIPVVLMIVFLEAGSFLNSEIIGEPTDSAAGVVFARPITDGLIKVPCCMMRNPGGENPLTSVSIRKGTSAGMVHETGYSPILLYLFFKPGGTEQLVNEFLIGDVKSYLFDNHDLVYESGAEPLHYTIFQEKADLFTARVRTTGIARHPTQVYETVVFLLVLPGLFLLWKARKSSLPEGMISGIFMITVWTVIMISGNAKDDLVVFEKPFRMVMGQILSIPLLSWGVGILIVSFRIRNRPLT